MAVSSLMVCPGQWVNYNPFYCTYEVLKQNYEILCEHFNEKIVLIYNDKIQFVCTFRITVKNSLNINNIIEYVQINPGFLPIFWCLPAAQRKAGDPEASTPPPPQKKSRRDWVEGKNEDEKLDVMHWLTKGAIIKTVFLYI